MKKIRHFLQLRLLLIIFLTWQGKLAGWEHYVIIDSKFDQATTSIENLENVAKKFGYVPVDGLSPEFLEQLKATDAKGEPVSLWLFCEGPNALHKIPDLADQLDGLNNLNAWILIDAQNEDEGALSLLEGERDNVIISVQNSPVSATQSSYEKWIQTLQQRLNEHQNESSAQTLKQLLLESALTQQSESDSFDKKDHVRVFCTGYKDISAEHIFPQVNTLAASKKNTAVTASLLSSQEQTPKLSDLSDTNLSAEPSPSKETASLEETVQDVPDSPSSKPLQKKSVLTDEMISWDAKVALSSSSEYVDYPYLAQKNVIREVQNCLRKQGYYHSSLDGVPGPSFHKALLQFQIKHDLKTHSKLDDETLAELVSFAGMKTVSKELPKPKPTYKVASKPKKTYSSRTSYTYKKPTYKKPTYKKTTYKKPTYKKPTYKKPKTVRKVATKKAAPRKASKPSVRVLPYLE